MGSCWWDRHLDDCSGPPLIDVIYSSGVKYICDTLIGSSLPALEHRLLGSLNEDTNVLKV